jgi:hypothetical protein
MLFFLLLINEIAKMPEKTSHNGHNTGKSVKSSVW